MAEAIDKLIQLYGNITEAAKAIGESRQTVQFWVDKGYIPYRQGPNIAEKTGGKITAIDVWQSASRTNSNGGAKHGDE